MSNSGGDFPALYEFSNGGATPSQYRVFPGRSESSRNLILLDVSCSRQQFRIVRRGGQFVLEPLSATVPTRCNGQVASMPMVLRHETLIEVGASQFRFLEHEPRAAKPAQLNGQPAPARPLPPRPSAAAMRTIVGARWMVRRGSRRAQPVVLSGQMLIGHDPERVHIVLPHTRVSRVHARIVLQQQVALLSDLHSANGTFVNGGECLAQPLFGRTTESTSGLTPWFSTAEPSCLARGWTMLS